MGWLIEMWLYKRKTLGDKNQSSYKNIDLKPRSKYTIVATVKLVVNDLLKELTNIRKQRNLIKISVVLQKNRADKWSLKYAEYLKHYKKVLIDNEQLCKINKELNLMHHQAIVKVLNLGQEIKKLKCKK